MFVWHLCLKECVLNFSFNWVCMFLDKLYFICSVVWSFSCISMLLPHLTSDLFQIDVSVLGRVSIMLHHKSKERLRAPNA